METTLEILKYTLPAIIVLLSTVMIVRNFLVTDFRKKQLSMLKENQEITVRLRLQAYERLVLFIERINPRSLVPRVYVSDMTVAALQGALIFNIRAEFEHNMAQQVYVSKQIWDTVRGVKEQEINMINNIASQLKPDAPAKELHMRIIDYVLTMPGELPTDLALGIINEEAKKILSYGAQA